MSERIPLGRRLADRSQAEAEIRVQRLGQRAFFIAQTGVAAAVAWWIAASVLHHEIPVFAPITAIICLGLSFGQRVRRSLELMVGVALGVFVGDVFVHFFGSGVWQIGVVVTLAMGLAALLGSGPLLTSQAGVQATFVIAFAAGTTQSLTRWLDAVIGGLVALAFALVAPRTPVNRPRREAAAALVTVAELLRETATGLRNDDRAATTGALQRARDTDRHLETLRQAGAEGLAVVRLSPLRRRHAQEVRMILELVTPLDRCLRNLRVLIRRADVITRLGSWVPEEYLALLDRLAAVVDEIAASLDERQLPTGCRPELLVVAGLSGEIVADAPLTAEVIRAQARSMIVDLLMVTGLDDDAAVEAVTSASGPD